MAERRPDDFLELRRDCDRLECEQPSDPLGRPASNGRIVDKPQGLERQRVLDTEGMMLASHGEHRGPCRSALVEDVDLGVRVAPELQRRSEEHTSELQSLMRISYAVFCLKKKKRKQETKQNSIPQ